MKYFSQIFHDTMSLHVGTNSKSFSEYKDFFHIKSIFDDKWYNFIVPKLQNPANLDIKLINKIIQDENNQGKQVSFYINHTLFDNYQEYLNKLGYTVAGDDSYLFKNITKNIDPDIPHEYVINSKYQLDEVINVLQKCFPTWSTEKVYSEMYEGYKKQDQEDRLFNTFVVHFENNIVGAGSISLDINLNLGYLHNTGVSEFHRRKGLHTALINQRCNFCLTNNVSRVVCIAEEHSESSASLQKSGFEVIDRFFIFIKNI